MSTVRNFVIVLILGMFSCSRSTIVKKVELNTERFGKLDVWQSEGEPQSAIIYFSSTETLTVEENEFGREVAKRGNLFIGVNTGSYLQTLGQDAGTCLFIAGEIERLGQSVQSGLAQKEEHPLILVGPGKGGTIVRRVLEQHPSPFLGGIVEEIEVGIALPLPFCPPEPKAHFSLEFAGFQAPSRRVLFERIESMASAFAGTNGQKSNFSDLPMRILPAEGKELGTIVFYSGDGGWASIDKALSRYFVKHGFRVLGLDSLKYFWKRKTPAQGSADLVRILESVHGKPIFLGGFSLGAEVLPFIAAGLPPEQRARVKGMFVLSAGQSTDFEVHISDWVGFDDQTNETPIAPVMSELENMPILCLNGEEDEDSLCKHVLAQPPNVVRNLPGGHHFDGKYDAVGKMIVEFIREQKDAGGKNE